MNTIPATYFQKQIRDLQIGERAWTVPWAMVVDRNGGAKLNGNYSAHSQPEGTVQLAIERVAAGFCVWLPPDYQWIPTKHSDWATLPVVEVQAP